ncbi:MAG: methylmalonyl-CoA mutase family protein [Chloroflexota bacterium]|nr:methylmalonyl-CoA mutase family protein [Chloroflexota bacterium]
MSGNGNIEEVRKRRREWEDKTLKPALDRFGVEKSPNQFYTPADLGEYDFLGKVGFPGEYPFTAGEYATNLPNMRIRGGVSSALVRAQNYSGYGTAEDTRDYYNYVREALGRRGGPNVAFDLPTQCGYDSDDPRARGEVGKVGVAVDTLRDFEVLYEAFVGENDLDKIASNWTINAPCNIVMAMYIALAEKRGVAIDQLKGTPQNDILKEFAARGTYIFPPRPSMRMTRDTITYCTEHMPQMNTISICGYHMREAGASPAQMAGFTFSNGMAYVKLGVDAGFDVDTFMRRFTFLAWSTGMEFFKEIARARAGRRVWARLMKERFGAKDPRSLLARGAGGMGIPTHTLTAQRPLNNVVRGVITGIGNALSGGMPFGGVPYDEPLGLGHSLEAQQLSMDAGRILQFEARMADVLDPLAGSYYVESLTDQMEEEIWDVIRKIDDMGGAVAAIEKGYMQREITRSAYQYQKDMETGKRVMVGVNRFTGEQELEVSTSRLVEHPYDPVKREEAEQKQRATLARVKAERDNEKVQASLKRLRDAAQDEEVNLIPVILEAVKVYASVGEMCGVLREVFGEYQAYNVLA